jgi:hypothetical protein
MDEYWLYASYYRQQIGRGAYFLKNFSQEMKRKNHPPKGGSFVSWGVFRSIDIKTPQESPGCSLLTQWR